MRRVGPEGLFLFMALVLALLIAFVLARMALISSVPARTARYRLYPRTTASAFQLFRKVRVRRELRRLESRLAGAK